MVCDFMELYHHLIDDFLLERSQKFHKNDFVIVTDFMFKAERMSAQKKGKREYLNDVETKDFTTMLNDYFETVVEIPRINVGKRQTIETLTSEEALLFAKYLRNEKKEWIPRIAFL